MKRLKVLMVLLALVATAFGQNYSVELVRKAESGDAKAQFELGKQLCFKSKTEAVHWWQKSAEQGYAWGQYALGNCYYNGTIVPQDYEVAVSLYSKAAKQGVAEAQYQLGECYYKGLGISQNYEIAILWYEKSAKYPYSWAQWMAQCRLGECYYEGKGVNSDYDKAAKYFMMANEHDYYGAAAFYLSKCYRFGRGVPQDVAKADSLQKEALEKGWDEAKSLDDLLKDLR